MRAQKLAKIYVEGAVYAIDAPFDYVIPESMEASLRRGCRVLVPFGRSNKKVQGLVAAVEEVSEFSGQLKPVAVQLDETPLITEEMFGMIEFLVQNTFCTYYEAVKTILPAGVHVEVEEEYALTQKSSELWESLPAPQQRLVEFLRTAKSKKELAAFLDCRQNPDKIAAVKALLEKGIVCKKERVKPKLAKKTIRMAHLAGEMPENLPKKQAAVAALLGEVGAASVKELCYHCGVTEGVVRALEKKGILACYERECLPEEMPKSAEKPLVPVQLSEKQQEVCDGIWALACSGEPKAALLYGVTGSGKTQVYCKLIEQTLEAGKTAMLLVPEIALTPQMLERFRAVFGDRIAVIHSGLSVGERMEAFERIRSGNAPIVIGTRSAVFAPLTHIGIIILDEEGESSYKSDASPRYHARDVAKYRCVRHGATLLLGSATPSIDSYYRAMQGKYTLFSLEERYAAAKLPNVYLIDMTEEQRQKNFSPVSRLLVEQLAQNLEQGEQSMLLINRRGYQTVVSCMECGEAVTCPSCSVAMTYHRAGDMMMCHYCGHTEPLVEKCPHCGGMYLKRSGTGTQKLEEELQLLFPQARILRMDTDTTFSRFAYEKNFAAFARGDYDILLGTQMIAKGLDFPNVTLVGVLGADAGLYSADYRADERVFSLITQVVGRSGRSNKPGRAYIQTYDPENAIIGYAAKQDYPAFFEEEIALRRSMKDPPFCDLIVFGISSPGEEQVKAATARAVEILREEAGKAEHIALKVLGASPAAIYKLSGKYRYRIVAKCRLNAGMKQTIAAVLKRCGKDAAFAGVSIFADTGGDMGI